VVTRLRIRVWGVVLRIARERHDAAVADLAWRESAPP
jgi:hypothetical protein